MPLSAKDPAASIVLLILEAVGTYEGMDLLGQRHRSCFPGPRRLVTSPRAS